jgi:hypothetical protein
MPVEGETCANCVNYVLQGKDTGFCLGDFPKLFMRGSALKGGEPNWTSAFPPMRPNGWCGRHETPEAYAFRKATKVPWSPQAPGPQ